MWKLQGGETTRPWWRNLTEIRKSADGSHIGPTKGSKQTLEPASRLESTGREAAINVSSKVEVYWRGENASLIWALRPISLRTASALSRRQRQRQAPHCPLWRKATTEMLWLLLVAEGRRRRRKGWRGGTRPTSSPNLHPLDVCQSMRSSDGMMLLTKFSAIDRQPSLPADLLHGQRRRAGGGTDGLVLLAGGRREGGGHDARKRATQDSSALAEARAADTSACGGSSTARMRRILAARVRRILANVGACSRAGRQWWQRSGSGVC